MSAASQEPGGLLALPLADDRTLSRYLLSVHAALRREVAAGPGDLSLQRLREAADIVARVAQQVEARCLAPADARAESAALAEAERQLETLRDAARPRAVAPRSIDRGAIELWLRANALGGPDTVVDEARLLSGGRCKTTALIVQHGARDLPREIVLRQDWAGGATETSVTGEYALLCALHAHGILVPEPLALEPQTGAAGSAFMLMRRIVGGLAGGLFEPPRDPQLILQLAEQIGRIHALPLSEVTGLVPEAADSRAGRETALAGFRQGHAALGLRSRIVDAALDWLGARLDRAGTARCLVHNDLGFHNALVEDGRLTAVLDWELAEIGHPASDLGYIKHFVTRTMEWDAFRAAYEAAGGLALDAETVDFHAVWNGVRLYGLIMQARANLAADRVDDIEITHACADNTMLLLRFIGSEIGAC